MITITKQEVKKIRKSFPDFADTRYVDRYITVTQRGKSNRGTGLLTTSVQYEYGESDESKIYRLNELINIMGIIKGNPEAEEAKIKLMVEKYKIEVPDWWDKSKNIKHPHFFMKAQGWRK